LQREPEAVVFAATVPDLRQVIVIQVKEAAQLIGRR